MSRRALPRPRYTKKKQELSACSKVIPERCRTIAGSHCQPNYYCKLVVHDGKLLRGYDFGHGIFVGSFVGQNRCFWGFLVTSQIFVRRLCHQIFLRIFVGKYPDKILHENPQQDPPKDVHQHPQQLSEDWSGLIFVDKRQLWNACATEWEAALTIATVVFKQGQAGESCRGNA